MRSNFIKKISYILVLLLFETCLASEIEHQYSLTHNSTTRANALGGAFTAVLDGPVSMFYNPAAFGHYKYPQSHGFDVYLNPIGFGAIIRDYDRLAVADDYNGYHWIGAVGLVAKSIIYSHQSLTIGLNLAESLPINPSLDAGKKPFSVDGVLDWNYDALTICLKLADQIYIGASGYYFKALEHNELFHNYGSSYGVFMNPSNKLSVGLSYFDYPENVTALMIAKNRTVDEAINIGVAYRPFMPVLFSLDIRNVSEDTQAEQSENTDIQSSNISKEIHAGIELSILSLFAFRSGLYRISDCKRNVYSFGVGLMDMNVFRSLDSRLDYRDFLVNYALEVEDDDIITNYRHYLTLLVRL